MSNVVIKAENISKVFKKGAVKNIWHSFFKRNNSNAPFYALKDISFEVKKGETLGIIGPNGAGKSTLLKILCGVTDPTSGNLAIEGRVAPLIEVGAGFHPELTGTENIYLNGIIMGLSKKEVDKKYRDIVDFAELWDFIDTPVKKYSSGMFVRLGFSVAVHTEPDILLVDEVLSVGDISFQRKCLQKIKEIQNKNISIIFIAHNMYLVQAICSKAIFLDKGKINSVGEVSEIIKKYEVFSGANFSEANKNFFIPRGTTGTGEIEILDVQFKNSEGKTIDSFSVGESIFVNVSYFAKRRILTPVFSVGFLRSDGLRCGLSRTKFSNIEIPAIEGNGEFTIEIEKIQLNSGTYLLEIAIADESIINPYVVRQLDTFTIINPPMPNIGDSCGIYFPMVKWDVSKIAEQIRK